MNGKISIRLKENISLVRLNKMLRDVDELIYNNYSDIIELNKKE